MMAGRHLRWGRFVGRVGAAAFLLFSLAPTALAANGAPNGSSHLPSIGTSPEVDPEIPSLTIGYYGPSILREGQSLMVSGSVSTTALSPAIGLNLVMRITTSPITDRAQLSSWDAGTLDLETREVARTLVGEDSGVPAAGSVSVSASAPTNVLALPPGEWGVYGVTITLDLDGQVLQQVHTCTTWLDTDPTVTPVSVVVVASGTTERVDALVSAAANTDVTFAVDPTLLSTESAAFLSTSNVFLLPAGNLDVASLARNGSQDILDHALDESREEAPAYFSTLPWIALATDLDAATVDLAVSREASAVIVVPSFSSDSSELSGYSGDVAPGIVHREPPLDDDPLLLVPDIGLSLALSAGPERSATAPARVVAETALLSESNPAGNPVLALAEPSWSVESTQQFPTLTALLNSPWTEFLPLTGAVDLDQQAILTLPDSSPSSTDIPASTVTGAGLSLRGLLALAAATEDPQAFALPLQDALFRSLAFNRRGDPEARDTAIFTAIANIDEVRAKVSLPGSSSLNLISASGNVPVNVQNDLDVAVTVTVVLNSRSPILRIHDRPEVVVAPGSTQQVLIPVTAVSSGNVVVRVSLTNHDGTRLTPVTEVHMRIRAQWGDAFTIGIASLAFALLIGGVFRTIRRGRADTRLGPTPLPDDESQL